MDELPPPQLPSTEPSTDSPARANRKVLGGVAAAGALVAVGGLVIGSQLVSADRPSIATSAAVAQEDGGDPPADETGTDEAPTDDGGTGGDKPFDEMFDDFLPPELKAEFEAFEQCLDEQLGGLFSDLEDMEWHGSVVVENFTGDGDDKFSMFDFGPGDATVTVTKTGDAISVETSGDVTTFDESDFAAEEAQFEAAEEACADLLPEDVKVLGDKIDVWLDGGEFPVDEAMLDELFGEGGFVIGDGMLDELFGEGGFPIDDGMLDEFFGEGGFPIDEATLDDLKEMFEDGEFPFEDLFDHGDEPAGDPADGDDDPATDEPADGEPAPDATTG